MADEAASNPQYAWPYLDELTPGEQVDTFLAVRKAELRRTRDNKPFLLLDLGDRTGHIKANVWDDAETFLKALPVGTLVKVRATPQEYQGKLELKLHLIRPVTDADEFEPDRFVPKTDRDPELDWTVIRDAVKAVEHKGIKQLLDGLLADEELIDKFTLAPAGKMWHHGYLGGLLEHTASIMGLVLKLCEHYPKLNRDLLVAGTLCHDIGKLWELQTDSVIDYTVRGRLEGHIVIGAEFLQRRMDEIEELDFETRVQIKHLVLSHQGMLEQSSPVVPMTREAFVLYYLDEIDSKLNALDRIYDKHQGQPGDFTEWVNLLGRHLYKGESQ
ncbi:HD domain-containing protein [bacterium]|nr:HD domain-containing protein [bacterium]